MGPSPFVVRGRQRGLATALAQAGTCRDARTGAVPTPIYQAATFRHPELGRSTGWDYARTANPTRSALEDALAEIEGGSRGLAFASGMAAIHAVLQLLRPGESIVVTEDLYGGTYRLLEQHASLRVTYVDTTDLGAVQAALAGAQALFVETPTNPLLRRADVAALVRLCNEAGAISIVDSTFATPWLERPLELGADVVVHSASKYLSGHNDVIAGAAITREASLGEALARVQNAVGAVLGPQDAFLVLRGLKTLALRMERHQENARRVAAFLQAHPLVDRVVYPGQGGMLSFEVDPALVAGVLCAVRVCLFAESLGGVETLITYPATQTHADVPPARRARLGITDRLLRLSVGIEDVNDIIEDLAQALANAATGAASRHASPAHGI